MADHNNPRQDAANGSHPDTVLHFCESVGTTIKHDEDGNEHEVRHQCRYPIDHPGTTAHQCWLCTTTWTDEVPC